MRDNCAVCGTVPAFPLLVQHQLVVLSRWVGVCRAPPPLRSSATPSPRPARLPVTPPLTPQPHPQLQPQGLLAGLALLYLQLLQISAGLSGSGRGRSRDCGVPGRRLLLAPGHHVPPLWRPRPAPRPGPAGFRLLVPGHAPAPSGREVSGWGRSLLWVGGWVGGCWRLADCVAGCCSHIPPLAPTPAATTRHPRKWCRQLWLCSLTSGQCAPPRWTKRSSRRSQPPPRPRQPRLGKRRPPRLRPHGSAGRSRACATRCASRGMMQRRTEPLLLQMWSLPLRRLPRQRRRQPPPLCQ